MKAVDAVVVSEEQPAETIPVHETFFNTPLGGFFLSAKQIPPKGGCDEYFRLLPLSHQFLITNV